MSSQTIGSSSQLQLVCCVTLDLGHYLSRLLQLSGRGWREPDSEEVGVAASGRGWREPDIVRRWVWQLVGGAGGSLI